MSIETAVDVFHRTLMISILLISPLMLVAIVIGVAVSLLQSITSIQEATLTFVPKLIGVSAVIIIGAHWMIRELMEFTTQFFTRIAGMGP